MIAAGIRGRPLRALSELAGLLGAEILGVIALGLGGALLALTCSRSWMPFLALPVMLAGAGQGPCWRSPSP